MNSVTTKIALVAAGVALALTGISATDATATPPTDAETMTTEERVDFWAARVEQDPDDYLSRTTLGQALVRQARETGDGALFDDAGAELREALATNPDHDSATTSLAIVRLSQHRFDAAARLAGAVYASDPGQIDALAVLGDAHLERGDYEAARAAYETLRAESSAPAVLARLANLARIHGDPDALPLARQAVQQARGLGLRGESAAFYEATLAQELFDTGHVGAAVTRYEAALGHFPPYHIALEGLARVRIAQGRLDEAESLYLQVREITPPPDFPLLVSLGDLATTTGDDDAAAEYYAEAETLADSEDITGPLYAREFSRYYADHDRAPRRALALAQADVARRQDVYAYDTLAWALYRNERYSAASAAAERALATGILDPSVRYHAGMVADARGEEEKARELLGRALAQNPDFDILQAPVARATLERLG